MKCKLSMESVLECAVDGLSYAESSRKLGVNKSTIRKFALKHNIEFVNKKPPVTSNSSVVNNVLEMYLAGKMSQEIASVLGINKKSVLKILQSNNVVRTKTENYNVKGRTIRPDAFSRIDEDRLAAYFFGWLLTDGWISDGGDISLTLKEEDRYVVEKLKWFVNASTAISERTCYLKTTGKYYKSCGVSFRDPQIYADLVKIGLEPRKSCKEKLPNFDWKFGQTAKDFWQGVIEGDGTICDYDHAGLVSLVGSEELLLGFREYCEDIVGVVRGARIFSTKGLREDFKTIRYNNYDAMLIVNHLYTDTVFRLERKYNKSTSLTKKETARRDKKKNRFVYYNKSTMKFVLQSPTSKCKSKHLGTFITLEEALSHREEFLDLYEELKNS